jgi:hypothetical protein
MLFIHDDAVHNVSMSLPLGTVADRWELRERRVPPPFLRTTVCSLCGPIAAQSSSLSPQARI